AELLGRGGRRRRRARPPALGPSRPAARPGGRLAGWPFTWETVEEEDLAADSPKLLAVSKTRELCIYEVILEAGKCHVTQFQTCGEHRLKKLIAAKNISLSSISTLKVLSFKNGRALLLLNNFIVVQLAFLGGERETEELEKCFQLELSAEVLGQIVDSTMCRGILFLLDKSGWIYVFDAAEGARLAQVNVSLYQAEGHEDKNSGTPCPLTLLRVARDLSVAVVANSSNYVAAIDLQLYFREYPDHLLCKRSFDNLPIEQLQGTDEDDIRSSDYNMKFVPCAFRTDRSWKACLSSLSNAAKRFQAPSLEAYRCPPWYQYLPHLEDYGYTPQEASKISLLQDAAHVLATPRGKAQKRASIPDRGWKNIYSGDQEGCVSLECKSVTAFSALLTISTESEGLILVLWDLETQDVRHACVGRNAVFVECSPEEQLGLVFSEPGLSFFLFGMTQQEFLNRLIIHGSAGTVDALCQLNAWGRCSIPVHALEAGLENRQLDTVDFFLKNKENLFSEFSACSFEDQPASKMSALYLEKLRPALDLLCKAIQENDLETQSKHFSEQLLNLTLSFLNKQLRDIFIHKEELDDNLNRCVDILTSYITKLRAFMIKFPHKPSGVGSLRCNLEDVPLIEQSAIFLFQQTVAEAILNNKLPEAQTFFQLTHNPACSLKALKRIGQDLVYKSLLNNDLKEASRLLRNMVSHTGCVVKAGPQGRLKHTHSNFNLILQVKTLQDKDYFSEAEKEMIDFVHRVEKVYSTALPEYLDLIFSYWRREQGLSAYSAALDALLNCCEDRVHNHEHRIMLNWARWWDRDTREMVLLPTQSPGEFKSCNPEVLWTYLTSWHDWASISAWIADSQPQDGGSDWPQLTAEAVEQRSLCSSFMHNEILDCLARNGTFVPAELENVERLLQRLALIGGVMQNPHPVLEHAPIAGGDFHVCVIHYCLERGLDHLLYTYLDYYSLCSSNCPILDDRSLHEAHPWFEFLVQCRRIASKPGDAAVIFHASLANAQVLIPSNQAGVSSMLLEGRTLLALASTMYAPGGIDRVSQGRLTRSPHCLKVDAQLFRMALIPYPKLRAALFPQCASHGALPSDVSLYHLAQALVPFDPSKLFGWQSANTLAIPDLPGALPHFSCPALVNRGAILERLDFCHYLRHARPSFALASFVVQQLARSKTPKQLVQHAGSDAYALALSCFYVPSVVTACACFLELLGLESLKLRVDAQAANAILNFMSRSEEPQYESIRQSVVDKLRELADGEKRAAEELLVCLEEAVWDKTEQQKVQKTSGEARRQWALVVQFCRLHGIKRSPSYLRACARAHEWLPLITVAQMYGYPPTEVVPILQEFSPPLQNHLRLAFGSVLPPGAREGGQGRELSRPRPEHRPHATDLFCLLLHGQEPPHPWQDLLAAAVKHHVPALAVLAACLEGAGTVHCLCVWIVASLDRSTAAEVTKHVEGPVETHPWDLLDLAALWRRLLRRRKIRTLLHGFRFFLKGSPLLLLLEGYESCMEHRNYTEASARLLAFHGSVAKVRPPPVPPVPWLESQAAFLLGLMPQQCRTPYELRRLLQLFADTGADTKKLSALSYILRDSPLSVDRAILTNYTAENFQNECSRILEQLQERSAFSTAREVAELAELPMDNIVIQEVLQNMHFLKQIGHWPQKRTRIEFWKKCNECFEKNGILNRAASGFFSAQADAVSSASPNDEGACCIIERQLLLSLAGHWLARGDPIPLEELEQVEREVWLCRIAQQTLCQRPRQARQRLSHQISVSGERSFESLAKEFSFSKLAALNVPEDLQLERLPAQEAPGAVLPEADRASLEVLIGQLLDEGSVHEASRACRYFNFHSRDVSLVLHCRALASGEAPRSHFHADVRAILEAREEEESERSGEGGAQKRQLPSSNPGERVAASLQALGAECVHGRSYCRQVLCLYELSRELGCSFDEISARDPEKLLRTILSSRRADRCRRAQTFIAAQGLGPDTVAELVAGEVTRELLAPAQGQGRQPALNPAEGSQALLQLARLCPDPALVGKQLLERIAAVPPGELACTTELLILAHSCFSLTCHMEGIIRVLQAARMLTEEHLAPSEEYGLVVRLLTGIGRYNEMTYIFDLLHEKHHFEVLMRKKLDSSGALKTALLDYAKRRRPGDSEKHNMIALCFSMCREIGENHEAAARTQLKLIDSCPWEDCLQNVPHLKTLLMKALTLFIDAAESYSKDFCVHQSLHCNRLTKLITLQLHFLNTNRATQLINLSRKNLLGCVMALPRFYQAAIVAEAYDFVPDWAEVLYQRVIVKGDFNYLEEYKQCGLLKASTFEEIAQKFKQRAGNESALKHLKKLLTYCDDIYVYYKLAYDNHFYDVVSTLLQDAQTGCCLNDLLTT
uniref:SPG11 vesicle trafficking associated, spatacsin n=1 Tax=Varanus komodoensis TaxID=61221 RepID=A0A8D2LLZ0_VARKO